MAENHGVPEAGQLPRGLDQRSQKVTKERAAQRVRSWIVQNEMRGLLDGCRRRCMNDSANPSEIRA